MNNKEIFRRIAAACSASDVLNISGISLRDSFGNSIVDPKIGKSYRSPLRKDKHPSFTFYIGRAGDVRFKDHGTQKSGSMINLLSELLTVSCASATEMIDNHLSLGLWKVPKVSSKKESSGPRNIKLRKINEIDFEKISQVIGQDCRNAIIALEGIKMLGVGKVYLKGTYGEDDCFFLYDQKANIARVRKLDGSKIMNAKSVCPSGYINGPLGISKIQANFNEVWIMEGEKDALAVCAANSHIRFNPICMTGVSASFSNYQDKLKDTEITIFAQNDEAGIESSKRWVRELQSSAESIKVRFPIIEGADWADILATDSGNRGFLEYKGEEALLLDNGAFGKVA